MPKIKSNIVQQYLYCVTYMKAGKDREIRVQASSLKEARNAVMNSEKPEVIKKTRKI